MMLNIKAPEARTTSSSFSSSSSSVSSSIVTAKKAFSFISKGWREVRSSADADLQLIKNRANSFKNLADKELENFLNSASRSPFAVPRITASPTSTPAEIDFVKKLRPKLTEIQRAYSSPDFKWSPKPKIRIDLSAIKNAIVSEAEDEEEDDRERFRRWRRVRFEETAAREEGQFWEPIRALKTRLREFEQKSSSPTSSSLPSDIFEGIKNSEFIEKFKSSLVVFCILFLLSLEMLSLK